MHKSIATIDSPEFINLQPLEINPLMSSCEIKVLYVGENRNHSFITKEVATEMAKTLRGAPIVGYYKEQKEDFADHGEKVIIDDEGLKFECLTKPYGFVSPDAKVWFQNFEDTDDFGNVETREYLMTTGYLWTGQYKECESVVTNGKNQSMELDSETLDGHWSTNSKTNMDFFIINDAIFSKLCILGDDVEPCFEGARITAPEVSTSFTKVDDNFKKTLYTMMQDLKFALEGGQKMVLDEEKKETVTEAVEEETSSIEETEAPAEETTIEENETATETEEIQESVGTTESNPEESFAKSDDKKDKEEEDKDNDSEDNADNKGDDNKDDSSNDDDSNSDGEDDKKKKKEYSLLESELEELKVAYSDLESKYQKLAEFKEAIDNEKKDALIKSFYMLSDEDKKEVIDNKSKYSLDEIEAKLSVICFRKKVNFDLEDNSKIEEKVEDKENPVVTYNMSETDETSIPAWIAAVKNTRDSNK